MGGDDVGDVVFFEALDGTGEIGPFVFEGGLVLNFEAGRGVVEGFFFFLFFLVVDGFFLGVRTIFFI